MYAIIVKDERELIELAKEKGLEIFKLEEKVQDDAKPETANLKATNINEFLLSLGIKPHIKGFRYLKYIFENDLTCEGGITKILYPTVAKEFNTTPSRVERAIRHAIESAIINDTMYKLYSKIFGNFENNPTNYQFIEGCILYMEKNCI